MAGERDDFTPAERDGLRAQLRRGIRDARAEGLRRKASVSASVSARVPAGPGRGLCGKAAAPAAHPAR